MIQHLRQATRQIARQPGFSAIIILTLALGVGAATTAFSVLNAVALRPPPYPGVDRLAALYTTSRDGGQARGPLAASAVAELPRTEVFDTVVAYAMRQFNAGGDLALERVSGAEIDGDLFGLLGTRLEVGRAFTTQEQHEGAAVAILGHGIRTRLYETDAPVLGATISLDGRPHTVIGIAPPGFAFPVASDLWVPLPSAPRSSAEVPLWAVGRLRTGVTVAQADSVISAMSSASGLTSGPLRVMRVTSLHESLISWKHQTASTALLIASGLVLLVACANLAGLVLASVSARRQELAVRAAIGADRSHLVRLLMTESVVLAAAGGMLGTILAHWGVDLFVSLLGQPAGAAWMEFSVDGQVLLFAIGLSGVTAVLFGLAPAMRASRVDIRGILLEGSSPSGTGATPRRIMAVAQIAVSLALVAAAAAVVASSLELERIPPGYDPSGVLGARVRLPGATYDSPAKRLALLDRVSGRLRDLPGVTGLTLASHIPLIDRDIRGARFFVDPALPPDGQPVASMRFVAGNFFGTMRIPVLLGRSFTDAEWRDPQSAVVLVNQTMAKRYWVEGEAVGRPIRLLGDGGGDLEFTVAGVVGDIAQRLPQQAENQVYFPLMHAHDLAIVVRTSGEPAHLAPHVRAAVAEADAALAVSLQTMEDAYQWYVWDRRAQGLVLAALGLIALLVAALGILGVMSLMVAHRHREIGVRIALGSSPSAIRRLVLGASLRLTATGITLGLLLGIAATSGLSTIFFGVRPFDTRVFVLAAGLLTAVALGATWWPARRAMAVDPITVLKAERI